MKKTLACVLLLFMVVIVTLEGKKCSVSLIKQSGDDLQFSCSLDSVCGAIRWFLKGKEKQKYDVIKISPRQSIGNEFIIKTYPGCQTTTNQVQVVATISLKKYNLNVGDKLTCSDLNFFDGFHPSCYYEITTSIIVNPNGMFLERVPKNGPMIGQRFQLSCSTTLPDTFIYWKFTFKCKGITESKNNKTSVLTFDAYQEECDGVYECQARRQRFSGVRQTIKYTLVHKIAPNVKVQKTPPMKLCDFYTKDKFRYKPKPYEDESRPCKNECGPYGDESRPSYDEVNDIQDDLSLSEDKCLCYRGFQNLQDVFKATCYSSKDDYDADHPKHLPEYGCRYWRNCEDYERTDKSYLIQKNEACLHPHCACNSGHLLNDFYSCGSASSSVAYNVSYVIDGNKDLYLEFKIPSRFAVSDDEIEFTASVLILEDFDDIFYCDFEDGENCFLSDTNSGWQFGSRMAYYDFQYSKKSKPLRTDYINTNGKTRCLSWWFEQSGSANLVISLNNDEEEETLFRTYGYLGGNTQLSIDIPQDRGWTSLAFTAEKKPGSLDGNDYVKLDNVTLYPLSCEKIDQIFSNKQRRRKRSTFENREHVPQTYKNNKQRQEHQKQSISRLKSLFRNVNPNRSNSRHRDFLKQFRLTDVEFFKTNDTLLKSSKNKFKLKNRILKQGFTKNQQKNLKRNSIRELLKSIKRNKIRSKQRSRWPRSSFQIFGKMSKSTTSWSRNEGQSSKVTSYRVFTSFQRQHLKYTTIMDFEKSSHCSQNECRVLLSSFKPESGKGYQFAVQIKTKQGKSNFSKLTKLYQKQIKNTNPTPILGITDIPTTVRSSHSAGDSSFGFTDSTTHHTRFTRSTGKYHNDDDDDNLAVKVAVPIVLILLLIAAGVFLFFYLRRKKQKKHTNYNSSIAYLTTTNTQLPLPAFDNKAYENDKDDEDIYDNIDVSTEEFPRKNIKFLEPLGSGTFSTVVKGEVLNENQWINVAIKRTSDTASTEEKEDFLREIRLLASIPPHANIVSYYGCCVDQIPYLMVLEYACKGDLRKLLLQTRDQNIQYEVVNPTRQTNDENGYIVPVEQTYNNLQKRDVITPRLAVSFSLQISRGLAHLAKNKIVHRDVAARNMLVFEHNIVKITDFGLARETGKDDTYARTRKSMMPIRWMSPEALFNNLYNQSSDVWAFGVLLWEIATLGSTPFPGIKSEKVVENIRQHTKPEIPTHVSKDLSDLISSCWHDNPLDRPPFSRIVQKIEAMLEAEGTYLDFSDLDEHIYSLLEPLED